MRETYIIPAKHNRVLKNKTMKEIPILFSTPMVQAILAGRKTQTRRLISFPKDYDGKAVFNNHPFGLKYSSNEFDGCVKRLNSKWQKDDLLWVRESSCKNNTQTGWPYMYKASEETHYVNHIKWKPSIHMPKEAARIWLEVTNVRVERLHDISRGDCMAEGCPFPNMAKETNPKAWFSNLWQSINGQESWDANPWVWVVEFKVLSTAGKPVTKPVKSLN